jgi:LPXTG-motif cell wall-anchored protein
MVGQVYGNLDYGTIYGMMNIFLTIGMAFAMPISGAIFDKTGSMVPTWYIFMGIAVLILLAFYFLLGRQPKVKETWHS